MKQKISFNPKIYLEGIRQLRVTGLLSVIIMFVISVLRIIGELPVSNLDEYSHTSSTAYTGVDWMSYLILSFTVITPILTMQMFHFMDKRNASDFYHSLPHTRSTIYLSLLSAVITWVLLSIIAVIIPSLFSAIVFSKYISLVYDTFFLFVAFCIASSILVAGAIMVAKGLTGTILNSIILTGVILFVPRFIMSLLIAGIDYNPVLENTIGNAFTRNDINPVVGFVFTVFSIDYMSIDKLVIYVPAIVYGFILGLLYMSLGMFLFIIRKSETASQNASNRKMHAVFRIFITTVLCIPYVITIFQELNIYKDDDFYWFGTVIHLIVVLFVYFLYELITTKKLKNLVKSIPGLGIVAAVNIAIYFGISGFYANVISFRPAADEIESVKIIPESYSNYYDNNMDYYNYVINEVGGIVLTDPEIISDISETLEQNLTDIDNSIIYFNNKYYSTQNNNEGYRSFTVEFETKSGTTTRNIYTNDEVYNKINTAVSNSKDFQKAWMSPPDINDIEYLYLYPYANISDEDTADLYNMYIEELENADVQEFLNTYMASPYTYVNFDVQYLMDGNIYYLTIPVYENITPNTYARYIELNQQEQLRMLNSAEEYVSNLENSGTQFEGSIYVNVYENEYSEGYTYNNVNYSCDFGVINSTDIIKDVLDSRSGDIVDQNSNDILMTLDILIYETYDSDIEPKSFSLQLPADNETVDKLRKITNEYNTSSAE